MMVNSDEPSQGEEENVIQVKEECGDNDVTLKQALDSLSEPSTKDEYDSFSDTNTSDAATQCDLSENAMIWKINS